MKRKNLILFAGVLFGLAILAFLSNTITVGHAGIVSIDNKTGMSAAIFINGIPTHAVVSPGSMGVIGYWHETSLLAMLGAFMLLGTAGLGKQKAFSLTALLLVSLVFTGCFRRGLVVVSEDGARVVAEHEQGIVDRVSDAVVNAMTPAIVGTELNSDEIQFCRRQGYSSGAFILTVKNTASLPAKVIVNGKHIPMACEDGRVFLEIPPKGIFRIFAEWGANEVSLQPRGLSVTPWLQYRMNMWYMWGGMGYGGTGVGIYGVWNGMMQQTVEITDQFLLQAYANTPYVTYITEAMNDRAADVLDQYRKSRKSKSTVTYTRPSK